MSGPTVLEVAVAVTMAAAAVAFAVGMVGLVILTCRRPCPPTPKVPTSQPTTVRVRAVDRDGVRGAWRVLEDRRAA